MNYKLIIFIYLLLLLSNKIIFRPLRPMMALVPSPPKDVSPISS